MARAVARRIDLRVVALTAAIAAVAVAGAITGVARMASSDPGTPRDPGVRSGGPFRIGDAAPTSFGVVAINLVERIAGLTPKQVAGVTHAQDFVPADRMKVDIAFTATSLLSERTAAFSPANFSLREEGGREIAPTSHSVGAITLQPDASVTGRVAFVAPRSSKALEIVYRDRSGAPAVVVALGAGSATREHGAPARATPPNGHGSHG